MPAPATLDPGPSVPTRMRPADFQHVGQQFADAQGRVEEIGSGLRAALGALSVPRATTPPAVPSAPRTFPRPTRPSPASPGSSGCWAPSAPGWAGRRRTIAAATRTRSRAGAAAPPSRRSRSVPTAAGAPAIVGEGESPVPDWAAQYWPNGDPDRMQDAGRAWQGAAEAVEGWQSSCTRH